MTWLACLCLIALNSVIYVPTLVEGETAKLTVHEHWKPFGNPGTWYSPDAISKFYSVCSSMDPQEPSQWLRSRFINVEGAKFINIQVIYTVSQCRPNRGQYCKHKLTLQAYHSDSDTRPDPSVTPFTPLVTQIAPKTWSKSQGDLTEQFYNTLNIAVETPRRGLYLAFYDQGTCMSIREVSLSYNYCMKTNKTLLVEFPKAFSEPANIRAPEVVGKCSDPNSQNVKRLIANCSSKGRWNMGQNVRCMCKPGFENRAGRCIVPLPPPPSHVNATFVNDSAVHLTWQSPIYERTVQYKIGCSKCKDTKASACNSPCGNKTKFNPPLEGIRSTEVTVSGLSQNSRFKFRVYSVSGENPELLTNKWKFAEVFIHTTSASGPQTEFSRKTSTSQSKYLIPTCLTVMFCLLVVIGTLIYWAKKKRRMSMEFKRTEETLILTRRLGSDPNYQDIDIPEDGRAKNKYENMPYGWEFPRCKLDLVKHLGSGNFGDVFKGIMRGTFKAVKNRPVAVKVTRDDADPEEKQDFLQELEVMKSLEPHPYVVTLLGCCTRTEPYVLILEYLPYGDLLGYLRRSRGYTDVHCTGELLPPTKVSSKDLMGFAWMIADGMAHLARKKIVHRDLAARNILVGDKHICKVSDFGLARNMQEDIYTRTKKATLPLKWMPPESLFKALSTSKSDVWSFGIVMWEIFTVGDVPYPQYLGKDVPALLQKGFRMGKPAHLKDQLYQIMLDCWKEEPEERPSFDWLGMELKKMMEDMQEYINLDAYDDQLYVNFDVV